MGRIVCIELENARFFAYHGFYPEEQILGNVYEISIKTQYDFAELNTEDLRHTVNYEALYQIAQGAMSRPRKLLETVANEILNELIKQFPSVKQAEVSIVKVNPPFGGDRANAKVSLLWTN